MTTQQQIEHAWELLDDGSGMAELRAPWGRLTVIRRELDTAVYELARRIEQLRAEVAKPNDEQAEVVPQDQ